MEAFLLPKIKEEQKLKQYLKEKLTYESTKFAEKNLIEYLNNLFIEKERKITSVDRSKERTVFLIKFIRIL